MIRKIGQLVMLYYNNKESKKDNGRKATMKVKL